MEHKSKVFSSSKFVMIVSYINIHANGLAVICSSSISHNLGLEGTILTIQAFFNSL